MLDGIIQAQIDGLAQKVCKHFRADLIFYYGEISPARLSEFRSVVEKMDNSAGKKEKLVFFLNTPGGAAETTEHMVDILRYHYEAVEFVVPDEAMSAGTIIVMSGDKIHMDYSSSLGPIDPQVLVRRDDGMFNYIPALGYLDKVKELIEKSKNNTISPAEFAMLQRQDLGMLRRYEQALDLSVQLLKDWLVRYKFSDWTKHESAPARKGERVTPEEKAQRAEEIARALGDNKRWHSHGRRIGVNTLKEELRLKIEDYSHDDELRATIRSYSDLIVDFVQREKLAEFLHSRTWEEEKDAA